MGLLSYTIISQGHWEHTGKDLLILYLRIM